MSSVEPDYPMPCHLDSDLLTLAVHLARRDVSRIRSPIDVNQLRQQQQQLASVLTQDRYAVASEYAGSVTVEDSPDPNVLAEPRPSSAAHVETGHHSNVTRESNHVARPSRSRAPNPRTSSETALPARGDSPPTRDTGPSVPSRSRLLHEPTEKQLQNARDSHLRQLQAKIARYSAAMAELRIVTKPRAPSNGDSNPLKLSGSGTRARGCSAASRFSQSTKRGRQSALIRHSAVPLCQKSRGIHSTRYQSSRSLPNAVTKPDNSVCDSQSDSNRMCCEQIEQRMERQVNDLWQQTVCALREHNPELVVLEPDNVEESLRPPQHYEARSLTPPVVHYPQPSQNQPDLGCSCLHEPNLPGPIISPREILHEIEQAEAEEAQIRRRWAHLSIGKMDETSTASSSMPMDQNLQSKSPRLSTIVPSRYEVAQPSILPELESSGSQLTTLRFENHPTNSERQALPIENSTLDADRVSLSLPTELHHAILLYALETKQSKYQWRKEHGLLSADSTQNLQLNRVCELISDELIDQVISDVADDLEQEISCLVDALVDGELHSEAPDSCSLTSPGSAGQPVRTPTPRPESSTCASGSFGSVDRLSSVCSLRPVSQVEDNDRSAESSESEQSDKHRTSVQSRSECIENPSYTFQFEPLSQSSQDVSDCPRSSATLLANLVLAESSKILNPDRESEKRSVASSGS